MTRSGSEDRTRERELECRQRDELEGCDGTRTYDDWGAGRGAGGQPLRAIREKCLDCSCGSWKEVELCPVTRCALHPFRLGKNPYRKARTFSQEQREAMAARLKHAREKLLRNSEKQIAP